MSQFKSRAPSVTFLHQTGEPAWREPPFPGLPIAHTRAAKNTPRSELIRSPICALLSQGASRPISARNDREREIPYLRACCSAQRKPRFRQADKNQGPQGLHVRVHMGARRDAVALLLLLGLNRTDEPDTERAPPSSRTRRSSGSPSSAFVERMKPKSNGNTLPCGSTALSRNVPRSKSNAYLVSPRRLDHGENIARLGSSTGNFEKFPPTDFRIELLLRSSLNANEGIRGT